MTASNVRRKSKTSEADGGGTATVAASTGSTDASTEVVLVAEGGGGAVPKGSTLGRLKLDLNWAALYLRNVALMGATMCIGSEVGKSSKPKNNKILWMKTGWKRA